MTKFIVTARITTKTGSVKQSIGFLVEADDMPKAYQEAHRITEQTFNPKKRWLAGRGYQLSVREMLPFNLNEWLTKGEYLKTNLR